MTPAASGSLGHITHLPQLPVRRSIGACVDAPRPGATDVAPRGRSEAARPTGADRRLIDSHGRVITDLRLSITDRCNFRCVYCMDPDVRFTPPEALLSVDELTLVVRACMALGIERVRLTGGEPTLRPDLPRIIESIASLGVQDLSLTTNGSRASPGALRTWRDAGLRRITFSLDAVEPQVFASMTRSATPAGIVVEAIGNAINLGFGPVKVNAVVLRGVNEDEVEALAALARRMGFEMRFIEFMPLDSGRRWTPERLVPADEIIARASRAGALVPCGRDAPGSTSENFRFAGDAAPGARLGVIAPVTRPFCGACSRLRITADGRVRPCLFSLDEFEFRDLLRDLTQRGSDPAQRQRLVEDLILDAVWTKQAGHGIQLEGFRPPDRPMSAIGG